MIVPKPWTQERLSDAFREVLKHAWLDGFAWGIVAGIALAVVALIILRRRP